MSNIDVRPLRYCTEPEDLFDLSLADLLKVTHSGSLPCCRIGASASTRLRGLFPTRCSADFFIAWRGSQPVGTICAAEDRKANAERGVRDCVFGFFNFIEDYEVMECLLSRTADWAASRGLDALTGPFNLDYEDSYGILVEGRDRPPALNVRAYTSLLL